MTPDTLGEIYEYRPTINEWCIAAGIFSVGFLIFTVLVKIAVPIFYGTFREKPVAADPRSA
jgi:molybdopterin-containing oxidoreductase family membrane subunit